MPDEEALFLRRVKEMNGREGRYRYLGFLNDGEAALCRAMARSGTLRDVSFFGGYPDAQRVLMRFGSEDTVGYEEPWPVARLLLRSAAERFSDKITHRDVLGALMGLGIEREVLGDQVFSDGVWHVFCRQEMAPHILTLTRVGAVPVQLSLAPEETPLPHLDTERIRINVSSLRADTVLARLGNLSRGKALDKFRRQEIRINGLIAPDPSHPLKEGDTLSVKGLGRFRCMGVSGVSKKGNQYLEVDKFV